MKKIKASLKKGGIADIVTLVIIVGLAIGLVVAVVIPMIKSSEGQVTNVTNDMATVGKAGQKLVSDKIGNDGSLK